MAIVEEASSEVRERLRVALHTCCGPCLLEPYRALQADHEVFAVFANPNIYPAEEYERRSHTLLEYAARVGIGVIEVAYDPALWAGATRFTVADRAKRCRACYELRLSMTAAEAVRTGCDTLATTLSVSPYQDAHAIGEVGTAVAAAAGLRWLGAEWSSRYPVATKRARALGMYRQSYCGCVPSIREAEESRRARRSRR
ncbi:MAG: epoxyqueuosine reductase QueH [Clostridiales bacterium]|nr:epoxyqueuosine reductase QueH [Clostridiales bacterium]